MDEFMDNDYSEAYALENMMDSLYQTKAIKPIEDDNEWELS